MVEFSDEEGYGRFLDLHEHYNRYINIKGIERCDYLEFLTHFDKLFDINKDKKTASYKEYIMHLMDYLYTYAEVFENREGFPVHWDRAGSEIGRIRQIGTNFRETVPTCLSRDRNPCDRTVLFHADSWLGVIRMTDRS